MGFHIPQAETFISRGALVADLVGVFAGAALGAALARRKSIDIVGFVVLGLVSGVGGGIVRDVLLQAGPPLALVNPAYLGAATLGGLLAFLVETEGTAYGRVLRFLDALSIGSFAVAGMQRTLDAGLSPVSAVVIGVIAAVGGGLVRDVLLRKSPAILVPGPFNAIAACAAAVVALAISRAGHRDIALLLGVVTGAALRLLSIRFRWHLPAHKRLGAKRPPRDG